MNNQEENFEETKIIEVLDDLVEEKKELEKPVMKENLITKIKNKWQNLPKQTKIIFTIFGVIIIIFLVILILFLTRKKEEEVPKNTEEEVPSVIVEEENYIYENGTLVFIDQDKNRLGTYKCKNEDENLCYVAYFNNTDDSFDNAKVVDEDKNPWLVRSPIYLNNYVFIIDEAENSSQTVKLYNIKEEKVEKEYQFLKKIYTNNNAVILKDTKNKYGAIEFKNNAYTETIQFNFDYLGSVFENKSTHLVAISTKRNLLVDETGKIITKTIPGTIKNFNQKYIKAKDDKNNYHIYDYNGKEVLKDDYDYVELYDDYALLVNNSEIYLKTYDNYKLNEEAIRLKSDDYLKEYVYSKEGVLLETSALITLTESNNILTLNILDGQTVNINLLEGKLSKDLPYINYFDGKIYIYQDTTKENLLGTYTCTNKNTIKEDTKTLENCTFASDTMYEPNEKTAESNYGIIPIFNERFVFIKDTEENATNNTIILYDLKQKRVLSRYQSVSTLSNTLGDLTFKTVNDYKVMAQNKNGDYGVIEINLSSVEAYIPFGFKSMSLMGDYYVAKNDDGYILLSGTEVQNTPLPRKIVNYSDEYITAIDEQNNYSLYDYEGNLISEGFTYIALYNTFYAAVKNNNLEIHKYEVDSPNLLEGKNLPALYLTKYYGSGTLAFKIEGTNDDYTIYYGTTSDVYESVYSGSLTVVNTEEGDLNEIP